jgi:hypothetical protein
MFSKNISLNGKYKFSANNLTHFYSGLKFQLLTKAIKSDNRLRLINYLVEVSSNEFFCQLNAVCINANVETYSFTYNGLEFNLKLNKSQALIYISNSSI